jgi:hypothetical protein
MNNKITLTLSTEQTNLLLEALGQQPFIKVYELISHIQRQAGEQLAATEDSQSKNADVDSKG